MDTAPSGVMPLQSKSKFTPNGTPRYFPGVTVLCNFHGGDLVYDEMVKYWYDSGVHRHLDGYVQLPKESLHMTIYDTLVYDLSLEPSDLDELKKVDMVRFKNSFLEIESEIARILPIRMRINSDPQQHPQSGRVLNVPLIPWDSLEEAKLNDLRQNLQSKFGTTIEPNYKFHISLCYPLVTLAEETFSSVKESWSESIGKISRTVHEIPIARVELCTFNTMFSFQPAVIAQRT